MLCADDFDPCGSARKFPLQNISKYKYLQQNSPWGALLFLVSGVLTGHLNSTTKQGGHLIFWILLEKLTSGQTSFVGKLRKLKAET